MDKVYTALVTPINKGKVDQDSLKALIDRQNNSEIDGVVALGSTAESTLLSTKEKLFVLKFIKQHLKSSKKLIVGVGSPSTIQTVNNCKQARDLGADELMVVTPYYTKYTALGINKHFEVISKVADLPLILYNVPHRTAIDVEIETTISLQKISNLYAVKECSGNLKKLSKYSGSNITLICGNDSEIDTFKKFGSRCWISVVSNLCPNLAKNNQNSKILRQISLLCGKSNPPAIKWALYRMGVITSYKLRLPLTAPELDLKKQIDRFVDCNKGVLQ